METVEVGRPAHHATSSGAASAVLSGGGQDDVAVDKLSKIAQMSSEMGIGLTTGPYLVQDVGRLSEGGEVRGELHVLVFGVELFSEALVLAGG